jgi:perosamine synthetase
MRGNRRVTVQASDAPPENIDVTIGSPGKYCIPMSAPDIQSEDIELVTQALQSKTLSLGPFLSNFERTFANYIGTNHAIGVANGTAGLHLCILAANIADGDEVITTPFSFVASANCILYERATPVFVDIDETSMNIDPELTRQAVTERTRAVLPVHVFGQPCAMTELNGLCRERDLLLIEDACEAVGAEYRGRKVGTFGKAAVFSFYPNKQMTMGEGAVITTDDPDWAALLRSLRNQGRNELSTWLSHDRLGYNYRLDELSAALGLSQLRRIEILLARRQAVAARYTELLRGIPGVSVLPEVPSTSRLSWFVYIIRLQPEIDRDRVIADLEKRQIPSRVYFTPIHLQPFYRKQFGFREGDFPVTERVAASTLALPFHGNLSIADMEYVAESLRCSIARAAV